LGRSKRREYRTRSRFAALSFFVFLSSHFYPLFFPPLTSTNEAQEDGPELSREKEEITEVVKLTLPQNEKCEPCNNDRAL